MLFYAFDALIHICTVFVGGDKQSEKDRKNEYCKRVPFYQRSPYPKRKTIRQRNQDESFTQFNT